MESLSDAVAAVAIAASSSIFDFNFKFMYKLIFIVCILITHFFFLFFAFETAHKGKMHTLIPKKENKTKISSTKIRQVGTYHIHTIVLLLEFFLFILLRFLSFGLCLSF